MKSYFLRQDENVRVVEVRTILRVKMIVYTMMWGIWVLRAYRIIETGDQTKRKMNDCHGLELSSPMLSSSSLVVKKKKSSSAKTIYCICCKFSFLLTFRSRTFYKKFFLQTYFILFVDILLILKVTFTCLLNYMLTVHT